VQAQNRVEHGAYDDDLFFRYGSQDTYSIFSPLAAPLVAGFGVRWGFFLLYVLGNALFILALLRFVRALLPDALLSSLSLIFLVVTPIPYGGAGSFRVMEPFTTPRLLAAAAVLFALERLLCGRYLLALPLLAAACLIHPLMTFGGLLVPGLCAALRFLSPRLLLVCGGLGVAATAAVLAYPPLGWRLFGRMDDDWLRVVYLVSPYLFPSQWGLDEWLQVVVAQVVVTVSAAAVYRRDARRGAFLAAVALVALAAVVATFVGGELGYRLLLQGQPYRFLWLVRLMQVPLTVRLAAHLYQRGDERSRLLAVGLLSTLTPSVYCPPELVFGAGCLLVLGLLLRGLEVGRADEAPATRPPWSLLVAVSLGVGLAGGAIFREAVVLAALPGLAGKITALDCFRVVLATLGPALWGALALGGLLAVRRRFGLGPGARLALAATFLLLQLVPFLVTNTAAYRRLRPQEADDVQFVAGFLRDNGRAEGRPPRLYWPDGELEVVWLELGATSYFAQHHQVQGAVFNRETALEGERRARVVRRFELERLRKDRDVIHPRWARNMTRLYDVAPEDVIPTRADLDALCQEEMADYAVLAEDFAGLAVASNGHVYIYDCRRLRLLAGP
jgi:hypothetical protein